MRSLPGREVELARLAAVCQETGRGVGRLVLLSGEAGIGKSRLASAVAEEAVELGLALARGWCVDAPGAPTLWPWRRAARDLPALRAALDCVSDLDAADGAGFRLVEAVTDALCQLTAERGLAVVLEDLHWADRASLDLLRRLMPELATLPVLVVATAREDPFAESPFGRAVPELLRDPSALHLALTGLTADAVATWLARDEQTSSWAAHADDLVRRTHGNPFYIRSLTSELGPEPGADLSVVLARRPTWRAVLVAPYRSLPAQTRETVGTAAVFGERPAPALLAVALGRPVREVSDQLAAAIGAGILHFGETGLAFRHALVRDAIVAELSPTDRTRAHAGVAGALEATDDPQLAGPAAMHWARVEEPHAIARCRDLAARAAAAEVFAPERGLELALLALRSARALNAGDDEIAERLLLVTRFEWAAGMLRESLSSCADGIDLAEAAGRPDLMADFALVPQGVGSSDVARVAGAMCQRALGALPMTEVARRARLLALIAVSEAEAVQSAHRQGDRTSAATPAAVSEQALAAARASGNQQAELEAIAARHYVLSYPQAIAERTELAARAVQLAASAPTTMGALWGHLWQADLAFQRGDLTAVQQAISEVERVARKRSSPVARWHALQIRAALDILVGRFDEARDTARAARALADRVGDLSMIGMHYAFHVQLAVVRGDPSELLPDGLDVIAAAPPMPLVRAALPVIFALQGDLERARAEFASLREVPSWMPLGPRWAGTLGQIGVGATVVGDAAVAAECYGLLLPCAGWCGADGGGSPFALGSGEYPLGRLAQAFGDLALAAAHFDRGIVVDDRIGARPFAALGRLALAESVAAVAPARARDLARVAADEFHRLDMPGPLAAAGAILDQVGHPSSAQSTPTGGLTARELEVALLVGRAMTNQQIADQLFLSVRTVESHVRSALAKLQLTTRTEIALWIRDRPS